MNSKISYTIGSTDYFSQGLALHQQGQLTRAKACYEKVLITQPSHIHALHLLGVLLVQSGLFSDGLAFIDKAIAKNPNFAEAHNNRAIALLELLRLEEALRSCDKAIALKPAYAEAFLNKGNVLQRLKYHDEALANYENAITINPQYAVAFQNRGNALKDLERIEEAKASYLTALRLMPNNADVLLNLGDIYRFTGQFEEALSVYNKALAIHPEYVDLHLSRGNLYYALGEAREALKSYQKAVDLNPGSVLALFNCGVVLGDLGRVEDALSSYSKALAIRPDYTDALINRGNILEKARRFEEALADYDGALAKDPMPKIFNKRGNALQKLKRLDEALTSYDKAIFLKPDYAEAFNNRGASLEKLKRLDDALRSYDTAIEFKSDYAEAYYNRGIVLHELKRLEEAMASYDTAIKFKSDYTEAFWNNSLAILLGGDFIKGFNEYEWRWKTENFKSENGERLFKQPLWLGKESLANKRILIYSEQGLGDTLQFCRYARPLAELGAKVILEVPRSLVNLLQNLVGVDRLISKGSVLPEFDYQCPLMSLPLAFKTTIETIPAQIPYIHSNTEKQNKWREHIGDVGFKIAICWQGSTKSKVDAGRSFPVSLFEGISKINGVRLISLQKNVGAEQLMKLPEGMKVETLPDDFDAGENAFLDSAAVMKCVDLVITSDTALTHLAGALGINAWLPLKYVPEWRWMLDRNDSPWYSNHRLFRQTARDDWTGVFKEMENELAKLLSTK